MNKHLIAMITLGTAVVVINAATLLINQQQSGAKGPDLVNLRNAAPITTSGDNTYIAWWTNKSGNDEVLFRASTDAGATFADKINLSNSTGAESTDTEIVADGDNIIITWWERNQTEEEPVARISNDNGQTFGPLLRLATNGTIGSSSDTE
jgi:hypothetical protein